MNEKLDLLVTMSKFLSNCEDNNDHLNESFSVLYKKLTIEEKFEFYDLIKSFPHVRNMGYKYELIRLCDAIDKIPGLTVGCHSCIDDKHPIWVWIKVDVFKNAYIIGRVLDNRYGNFKNWTCQLNISDSQENPTSLLLESTHVLGEQAYKEADELAKEILDLLNNKVVLTHFDIK